MKCQCGNPLREGERECDKCLLGRYELHQWQLPIMGGCFEDYFCFAFDVAQALRRAYRKGRQDGYQKRTTGSVHLAGQEKESIHDGE